MDKTLSIHGVSHGQVENDQLPILKYELYFIKHISDHPQNSNSLSQLLKTQHSKIAMARKGLLKGQKGY